ncbi:MAG: hypothetical protein L7G90_03600 [Candidatus Nanopusillus sp.]|nr:hypothetical protein [Candidatus Nanopusillus sp.]
MSNLELLSVILGFRISQVVMILVLGWIIGSIPIYLVAKYFNKNVSFEKALGSTILSEIVLPVIIGILYFFLFILISIIAPIIMTFKNYILNYYILIFTSVFFWIIGLIGLILDFLAVVYIYKTAFNVSWRIALVISIVAIILEIILILIVYAVAGGISTVNTPVGQLNIYINGIMISFILGLLLSIILIYLVAKYLNINISFLATSIVNLLPGIVSFIIIIISVLLFILAENTNVAFFIGAGIIFIVVSISYKYILNISWRKAILMSIIFSGLWSIIGLFIGLISFSFPICC